MFRFLYTKSLHIKIRWRNWFWRKLFAEFGLGSKVFGRIVVFHPANVYFGAHSTLNEGVLLNARAKIQIGDYVHISPFCIINTGRLDYEKTSAERIHQAEEVIIEEGVWLGSGAIVNPGVKIGAHSVIGAGAVVTEDIPPRVVAVGVPAKVVKEF